MLQRIDLRRLAERNGPARAYVSLYLSGPEALGGLRRREERIRAVLEDGDERTHFDEGMRLVERWLEAHGSDEPCCVFACWAEGFCEGFRLPVAVPDLLRLGPAPYLRPLAEVQEENESYVVVAADNRVTRVFTVDSTVPTEEERIRGDVKNRVRKGGWSQRRYARRREKELHEYAKEVAEVLQRLVLDEGYYRIVLLGSKETLEEIVEVVPRSVADAIVAREGAALHEGDDELLAEAAELAEEEERRDEHRTWDRIRGELFADGLGAAGPEEVLAAAMLGRVDTMVVDRDARLAGSRCSDCDNLFVGTPKRCRACGGDDLFEVDLVDALVRQLELTSADVDFVDPIDGLAEVGGVAALLRY